MDPTIARQTWRTLEPIHAMVYFVPEADDVYSSIGLRGGRMGYFASRAASMGPVPAEVVIATFYNFNPHLVRKVIPAAWALASPADVLAARLEVVDRALRRIWGPEWLESVELTEAASLARQAAEVAGTDLAGRPLFAGHAALPWPAAAHLALWHAQSLLREYRGDGHIAALLIAGLDPLESLVTHAAAGDVGAEVLRATRGWSEGAWDAAVERLRGRGLVAEGAGDLSLTPAGRRLRQQVEEQTDARAAHAYRTLGPDGCQDLRRLARPLSQAVVGGGLLRAPADRFQE